MSLTALNLVQEAAKRLNIMVPTSIESQPNPETSTIDYDANMLVAALNSAVRQNASINLFNREVQMSPAYLNAPKTAGTGFPDIVIDMSTFYPDFESLLGDSITLNKYDAAGVVTNKYAFREFSAYDFATKQQYTNYTYFTEPKPAPVPSASSYEVNKNDTGSIKKTKTEDIKNSSFSFPTRSPLGSIIEPPKHIIRKEGIDVETKGNGFRFIRQNFTKLLWICNDIISQTDLASGTIMLVMLYYSTWIVSNTSKDGTPSADPVTTYKDCVDSDNDIVNLPDELAILGTIIGYKSTNGLDYSLELGQQKALIEAVKVNQENVRYTHNTNVRQQAQAVVPQER
jgi:hypothetical protein